MTTRKSIYLDNHLFVLLPQPAPLLQSMITLLRCPLEHGVKHDVGQEGGRVGATTTRMYLYDEGNCCQLMSSYMPHAEPQLEDCGYVDVSLCAIPYPARLRGSPSYRCKELR